MSTRRLLPIVFVALFLLVGCRDRSTVQDAQDDLCAEVSELDGTAARIAAVEPNAASVAQVRALRAQLEAQFRDVEEAAREAQAVNVDAVRQSYNSLLRATGGVNDQAALVQAEPQIDQAAGALSEARLQLNSSAGC